MTTQQHILIIEDDPDGLRSVVDAVTEAGYEVTGVDRGSDGVERFKEGRYVAVLTDLVLPDIDGIEVLNRIRRIDDQVPVLIMTAYGTVPTAVDALKSGAFDYILKPLDLDDLESRLARAAETGRLRDQVQQLKDAFDTRYTASSMVAQSDAMQDILRQIEAVAGTDATVLVLGESGTGKELVARALHADGKRTAGPFVAVNCGAFSESLLESELFGHEKGAFTGAVQSHKGAFERADGGTLFLDEIALASQPVQTRLLRALEEREVVRVGGQSPIRVDVRVVSATNRELVALVEEKEFRDDLMYRLQVVTVRVPPLRDRRDDIRPLVDRFVTATSADHGRHISTIDPGFYTAAEAHRWPGNVRQLRNAIESAVIMANGSTLTAEDLRVESGPPPATGAEIPDGLTLAELEKQAITGALRRNQGNRTLSAEELGISVRTVQRKIKEHGLPF